MANYNAELGMITVWYHGEQNLSRFIENCKTIFEPSIVHIMVINKINQSALKEIKSSLPDSIIVNNNANIGLAAAWNIGISILKDKGVKYIGIWNPDIKYNNDCLQKMYSTLKNNPEYGAVSPLLFYSEKQEIVQMYGGRFDLNTGKVSHMYRDNTAWKNLPEFVEPDYLDGGTMMIKTEVLDVINGFDESYFLYGEDVDICIRIKKSGYRLVSIRDAYCWHYHNEHRSTRIPSYERFYYPRSIYLILKKHSNYINVIKYFIKSIIPTLKLCRRLLIKYDFEGIMALLMGHLYGLLGIRWKKGWVS